MAMPGYGRSKLPRPNVYRGSERVRRETMDTEEAEELTRKPRKPKRKGQAGQYRSTDGVRPSLIPGGM